MDYQLGVLAVAHNEFKQMDLRLLRDNNAVVVDVKSFLPKEWVDMRL
jgi:UDP-N-acetyl-D-galactosamine dehydrogenase